MASRKKPRPSNAAKGSLFSLPPVLATQSQTNTRPNLRPRPEKPSAPTSTSARRSSAQVQQEKAEAQAHKRNEVRQQQEAIAQAAANDHRRIQTQRVEDASASNPEPNPDVPSAKIPRVRPNNPSEDGTMEVETTADDSENEDPSFESADNEMDDLSPEKRRKGEVRILVDQLKAFHNEPDTEGDEGKAEKRNRSDSSAAVDKPPKKSKKSVPIRAGVYNWKGGDEAERNRSTPSTTDYSSDAPADPPQSDLGMSENDDFEAGGISDNEEGEVRERDEITEGAKPRFRFVAKQPATARVNPSETNVSVKKTESVTEFVAPAAADILLVSRINKSDITKGHMPQAMRQIYDDIFLPVVIQDIANGREPWDFIEDEQLCKTHKKAFPNEKPLTSNPTLFAVFSKLTGDAISQWRNKFAQQAMRILETEILNTLPHGHGISAVDARKAWVTWALSGKDHERVFYYRVYEEKQDDEGDPEAGTAGKEVQASSKSGPYRAGLFQSLLISSVLSVHYASILTLPEEHRSKSFPAAALVLAIQACKRALASYTTGEKVIPHRPLGNFSKSNWGDREEIREGQRISINTTSKLFKIVDKVKDSTRKKIVESALAWLPDKRRSNKPRTIGAPVNNDGDESDFELVDDDEDDDE